MKKRTNWLILYLTVVRLWRKSEVVNEDINKTGNPRMVLLDNEPPDNRLHLKIKKTSLNIEPCKKIRKKPCRKNYSPNAR